MTYGIKAQDTLIAAGVPFTTEEFLSGFWGTRIIFENRKDAKAAEKALGERDVCRRYWKRWAITYYQ